MAKNILYAETAASKNICIHTENRAVTAYTTLTRMEDELSLLNFYRCHASYLVNLDFVKQIGNDFALLRNNEKIPVSKHRRKAFVQAFCAYVGGIL